MVRAERRKQLLKIARDLVAEDGMGALTMTALSERADVAKPVVYSHFANRHQVAIALLDEHFHALNMFSRDRITNTKTLEEYLSTLVDGGFEFEGSSSTPVRKITNGFSAGDEVNKAFERHEETIRLRWRKLLEMYDVPKDVAEIAAYAMLGIMNYVVFNAQALPNRRRARDTVKKLILSTVHELVPPSAINRPFDATRSFDLLYSLEASAGEKKAGRKVRNAAAPRGR
jgi:AcrR family transcriptional regulator